MSYFFPLLAATERRLGFRPPYGALDAACDAFYVCEYFHAAGGFAAVPFTERSSLVEHECGRYVCPLLWPEVRADTCSVDEAHWPKGGCVSTLPLSVGARVRHTLDRHSDAYQAVYTQRTATERINSQAVELGIERPKIRNGQAIANLNTLIYVLINLRALQRLRQHPPPTPAPDAPSTVHA